MSVRRDPIDDERIDAFVDGELSPAEGNSLEAEAAADPALAARIERARALRAAVAEAFADAIAEPAPARLLTAIEGGADLVDLGQARLRRPRAGWAPVARWGAIAASLALAFYAGRLVAPGESPTLIVSGPGGLIATGPLADGLEHQLASSQPADAAIRIGVSFQDSGGEYCRTFLLRHGGSLAGLACREPEGWRVRVAAQAASPGPPRGAYVTAGEETPAAVLEAVDQSIRGAPLDAAAETRARAAGWRTPGTSRRP